MPSPGPATKKIKCAGWTANADQGNGSEGARDPGAQINDELADLERQRSNAREAGVSSLPPGFPPFPRGSGGKGDQRAYGPLWPDRAMSRFMPMG